MSVNLSVELLATKRIYELRNCSVRILLRGSLSNAPLKHACNETQARQMEKALMPMGRVEFAVIEEVKDVSLSSLLPTIIDIYSLNYRNKPYRQLRQYLEVIRVSVVDYQIVGEASNSFFTPDMFMIEFNKALLQNPSISPLLVLDPFLNTVATLASNNYL